MTIYYTYILVDPRHSSYTLEDGTLLPGEPFYVGKGKLKRAYTHLSESSLRVRSHKCHKIKSIMHDGCAPVIHFYKTNLSEEYALASEKQLIREIGTHCVLPNVPRGPLTNLTSGGEGWSTPPEVNARKARKGELNGMFGRHRTEKEKANQKATFSKRTKEENIASYSRKKSPEEIRKMLDHRPDTAGANNSRAKHITIETPSGELIECFGTFRQTCERLGLNSSVMIAILGGRFNRTTGKYAGYKANYSQAT